MEPTTEQGAFEILRLPLSMPDAPSRLNDVSTVHCHLIGTDNYIQGSSTESPCADRNQIEASTCIDTRPEEDAAQYRLGVALVRLGNSSLAAEWLGRSARQGYAEAQYLLGVDASCGRCWSDAAVWLRHAAEQGHEGSLNLLRESAEAGNPHSQWVLGEMYSSGSGVDVDRAEGVLWALCAAKHGHLPAWKLLNSAVGAECAWAPQLRQLLRQVANYGAAGPQCRLGRLHLDAAVAERVTRRATNWSSLAAGSGHGFTLDELRRISEGEDAEAQWRLGRLYLDGTAVEQNAREAAKWLGLAVGSGHDAALEELHEVAEGGDMEAQWRLGRLYLDGLVPGRGAHEAAHWFSMAASSGHRAGLEALRGIANGGLAEAECRLGSLYLEGLGVERDEKEAAKWFGLAAGRGHGVALEDLRGVAEGGEKEAQWRLGRMHINGEPVERDVRAAVKWFGLAAGHGHADALDGLREIAEGGDAEAQWRLGLVYLASAVGNARGAALEELRRVVNDSDGQNKYAFLDAMSWIKRAADTGHTKAWILIFRACEAGYSEAVRFLVSSLKNRDQPAVPLLYDEADSGNAWAQSILADFGFPPYVDQEYYIPAGDR